MFHMNETAKVRKPHGPDSRSVLTAGVNRARGLTYSSWILETYTMVRGENTLAYLFHTLCSGTGISDGFPQEGQAGEVGFFVLSS